jgi:hypothetical protein
MSDRLFGDCVLKTGTSRSSFRDPDAAVDCDAGYKIQPDKRLTCLMRDPEPRFASRYVPSARADIGDAEPIDLTGKAKCDDGYGATQVQNWPGQLGQIATGG